MARQPQTAVVLTTSTLAIALAGWYATSVPAASVNPVPPDQPRAMTDAPEFSQGTQPLDRSAFDVVLWHDPPPPPAPAEKPRAVAAVPPPPVDLLAITQTASGYEGVFYDKQADRLQTVVAGGELGSYRVGGIGSTWVRLDHDGRTTTLRLDQPRIAAREGEGTSEGADD